MRRRATTWLTGFAILANLGVSPRAGGEEPREFSIWYRSAEGCPDGDAFLARLESRGVRGRLARVGDSVDFVVTLGNEREGAQGLLERQTATGTVAVRRLDATDCDQVADAIALVLVMASESVSTRPATTAAAAVEPAPQEPSATRTPMRDGGAPVGAKERHSRWAMGAQGGALIGVTPAALPQAAVFVQLEPWAGKGGVLGGASVRGYVFGGTSSRDGSDGALSAWIVAGRLEACPLALGTSDVSVSPCLGFDLGTLHGSKSGANAAIDQGIWGALEAVARLSAKIVDPVSIEAQMAAVAPVQRYEFASEQASTPLYVASAVGLSAAAGVSVQLP